MWFFQFPAHRRQATSFQRIFHPQGCCRCSDIPLKSSSRQHTSRIINCGINNLFCIHTYICIGSCMNTKVAVATVQGKTYFLIVNKLKEKNIPFLSLIPGETVPTDIKVVITTEEEKRLIKHEKILTCDSDAKPETMFDEIIKILQGKKSYDKIIIGIDPGNVCGLAIITDGKISETENCFSTSEVSNSIKRLLRHVDPSSTQVIVKIGNGVPAHKEMLATLNADL